DPPLSQFVQVGRQDALEELPGPPAPALLTADRAEVTSGERGWPRRAWAMATMSKARSSRPD
ncbi:MAG: hypothetical protein QOE15_2093, partial [Acidimicrobiaceae bacterium]|nr:hypothetical protein [Acidimicrobiaceae bacterium]